MRFKVGVDGLHKPAHAGGKAVGDHGGYLEKVVDANEAGRSRGTFGDKSRIYESVPEGDHQHPEIIVVLAGKHGGIAQKDITAGDVVFWRQEGLKIIHILIGSGNAIQSGHLVVDAGHLLVDGAGGSGGERRWS